MLAYCYEHEIPVTARGSGTGNYGQAVPLHGGVVLDLQRMDQIEEITADGVAQCQPGVRLAALEAEARKIGLGAALLSLDRGEGIGRRLSRRRLRRHRLGRHGGLRDFNTVRAIEVVTMEAEPRVAEYEGEKVHDILHAWGTNGIITRIWLALDAGRRMGAVCDRIRYLRGGVHLCRDDRQRQRLDEAA